MHCIVKYYWEDNGIGTVGAVGLVYELNYLQNKYLQCKMIFIRTPLLKTGKN